MARTERTPARSVDLIRSYGRRTPEPRVTSNDGPAPPSVGLGAVPLLAAISALGLLVLAIGDARSRQTISSSQLPFWVGLLLIYIPIAFRLATARPPRGERLTLVLLLGLALYLVKIFFAPFGFLFADELAHEPNANAILATHHLFHQTSILPVTAYYPGLEATSAAISSLTGLTTFGAGLVVVGAARLIMMLALFLLFERLSGSAQAAGLGTLAYTANSNFVFFDAQFAYESLALPLLLVAFLAIAEWRVRDRRHGWSRVIVLMTVAIIVTHHVTSYALTGFLLLLCGAYAFLARERLHEAPWKFAGLATIAVIVWVATAARATIGYLWPVVRGAVSSTFHTLQGQTAPRQLFAASGYQPPILERATGILTVLLLFGGSILGLRALWRDHRHDPYALLLGSGTIAFFGSLVARYAPAAWETANRASEFLFIGLAFVVGLIGFDAWFPRRSRAFAAAVAASLLGIVFAGGVISGWAPELRLAQPYRLDVKGRTVDAEGRQLARFVAAAFPGRRFAASDADARLLASYADAWAIAGKSPDVYDILRSADFPFWQEALLRKERIHLIAIDRRDRSFDNTSGYYFGLRPPFGVPDNLLPRRVVTKFEDFELDRPYDSGNIVLFRYP